MQFLCILISLKRKDLNINVSDVLMQQLKTTDSQWEADESCSLDQSLPSGFVWLKTVVISCLMPDLILKKLMLVLLWQQFSSVVCWCSESNFSRWGLRWVSGEQFSLVTVFTLLLFFYSLSLSFHLLPYYSSFFFLLLSLHPSIPHLRLFPPSFSTRTFTRRMSRTVRTTSTQRQGWRYDDAHGPETTLSSSHHISLVQKQRDRLKQKQRCSYCINFDLICFTAPQPKLHPGR